MQTIENKILYRVRAKDRGWVFSRSDFLDLGSVTALGLALTRLLEKGLIRRVMRGIYDYPKYSKLLDQNLPPNIDSVAHAIARKNGWNIEISGNAALNLLGLSTQVPGKYLYLNDSRTKTYAVGNRELVFKKSRLKDMGVKLDESAILVQALRALDRKTLTEAERKKVRNHFGAVIGKKILKDTRYTTAWIYEEIKRIFVED